MERIVYLKSLEEIPDFISEDEEVEFWATHSLAKVWDKLKPEPVTLSPHLRAKVQRRRVKKPVTLRLDQDQIRAAKAIARKKSLSYQALLRIWIAEGIQNELEKKGA